MCIRVVVVVSVLTAVELRLDDVIVMGATGVDNSGKWLMLMRSVLLDLRSAGFVNSGVGCCCCCCNVGCDSSCD